MITCGVIVLTLLQALLLPAVVRFARLPVDNSVAEEIQLAEVLTLDAASRRSTTTAAELGSGEPSSTACGTRWASSATCSPPPVSTETRSSCTTTSTRASLSPSSAVREALLELRDEQRIDDIVLRRVQARLDIEEVRISRTIPAVE